MEKQEGKSLSKILIGELLELNRLKKGSWITRKSQEGRSYSVYPSESGYEKEQKFCINSGQEILGRFMYAREDGCLEIAGQVTGFELAIKWIVGYTNGATILHDMCDELYSTLEYGIISSSINEKRYDFLSKQETVTENMRKIKFEEDKSYWLAEQAISRTGLGLGMKHVLRGIKETVYLYNFSDISEGNAAPCVKNVCPWHRIATRNSNLKVMVDEDHNGLSVKTPFEIVFD